MSDFLSLSCPSCGGTLKSLAGQPNGFICEHCENEYLLKQSGNAITLHRISENVLNVWSSSTVVQARTVYMASQPTKEIKTDNVEIVECPICGKRISVNETFRCKQCQRANICLSHQDNRSYTCSECNQQVSEVSRQKYHTYWKAIALNLLGGFGLFYIDKKAKRKWIYPLLIFLPIFLRYVWFQDVQYYEDGSVGWSSLLPMPNFFLFSPENTIPALLFISLIFYVISFVDVLFTCEKKWKEISD